MRLYILTKFDNSSPFELTNSLAKSKLLKEEMLSQVSYFEFSMNKLTYHTILGFGVSIQSFSCSNDQILVN